MRISPSILSADFANLATEVGRIRGADWVHVDVMDQHFVPNLTLGLPVVEALAKSTDIPLDCHLMIEQPQEWAPRYAEVARSVTVHAEAVAAAGADLTGVGRDIRAAGARAGIALKPDTPLSAVSEALEAYDMVLVMTVEPGFGGQSFRADQLPKVRAVRAELARRGLELWLQVDGGVSADTIAACAEAGADTFVAGSAVYGADDPAAAVTHLRSLAQSAR